MNWQTSLPRWLRLNWLGLAGASFGMLAALTPSLLPRPWKYEGGNRGVGRRDRLRAVGRPAGWTDADASRLQALIDVYPED